MLRYYFRILHKPSLRYFYYEKLPKNIMNNDEYWIKKLTNPIEAHRLNKNLKSHDI
jgi:hypothetical protein